MEIAINMQEGWCTQLDTACMSKFLISAQHSSAVAFIMLYTRAIFEYVNLDCTIIFIVEDK